MCAFVRVRVCARACVYIGLLKDSDYSVHKRLCQALKDIGCNHWCDMTMILHMSLVVQGLGFRFRVRALGIRIYRHACNRGRD